MVSLINRLQLPLHSVRASTFGCVRRWNQNSLFRSLRILLGADFGSALFTTKTLGEKCRLGHFNGSLAARCNNKL
jgi:hypothetical protein